jgi:hypothetical protein
MASAYSIAVRPLVGSIVDAIEDLVARVPPSREHSTDAPSAAAKAIARKAATRAATLSGALALPPGVFGLLTVLPDLIAIWRIQAQMVSDLAGVYGKEMELTRTHMLYCLFRHASSQLARDVVVRAGQRFIVKQLSGGALRSVLTSIGISISQRVAGTTASRWVPVLGAAAVAGYAYFDTLQVAKTAVKLLEAMSEEPAPVSQNLPTQSSA